MLSRLLTYLFLVFLGGLFLPKLAGAQSSANYTVTRSTGISYTSIATTGTSISSWRTTSTDDNRSNLIDIGFDFFYLGTRYTQVSASTNGFIDFSTSTANGSGTGAYGYLNSAFTSTTPTGLALAPMYEDLITKNQTDPLGDGMKYQTTGSAPNRVFTVEWINFAQYGQSSPDLNFQVKLYESTGVIEYVYGTMTAGTPAWSYSCGINAGTISAVPTVAQLNMQQTANTSTFNNTVQNALATIPATNSKLTFTPQAVSNATGALTFSGISSSGMTLNFTDWATTELGYVIYYSTDNTNFYYHGIRAAGAGALTYAATGLVAGTTYYWQVYAYSEGDLSTALTGSQATSAAASYISAASGSWNTGATWVGGVVPASGSNVTIANGHTVTVNTNITCNTLTIGQGTSGTLTIGNNATARTVVVNSTLTVNNGATLNVGAFNATHLITLKENVVNNGTISFLRAASQLANVTFSKNGSITYSGTAPAANNVFNLITVNMGAYTDKLEFTNPGITATTASFMTLTKGTVKLSFSGTNTYTTFPSTISSGNTLWLNSTNTTLTYTAASVTLNGNFTLNAGTVNVGSAANNNLIFGGGLLTMSGGTLTVAGQVVKSNAFVTQNLTLSGGTLTVANVGSTSTTAAPFDWTANGSSFYMSGGTIVIANEGGSGGQNLGYINTGATVLYSVTGGTIQFGTTTTAALQTMLINSTIPVYNLYVNSANATAQLSAALTVSNDITISNGTLNGGSFDLTVGGNWSNSSANAFVPGTQTTTFNSSSAKNITRSTGTESFNSLTLSGNGTKTLGSAISCTGNITISVGSTLDVSASNYSVGLTGNWSNSGTFTQQSGTVTFNGSTQQSITGATNWYNLTINNTAGAILSSGAQNLYNTLTLSNGTFNLNGQTFTFISNSANTANLAPLAGTGAISGNITMQRFIPGGSTGWGMLGMPVTGGTLAQWSDDFYTSGFTGSTGGAGNFVSIYTYNEAHTNISDSGYVAATNITNTVSPGAGFFVYLGTGATTTTDITAEVVGPAVTGNFTYTPTFTDGPQANTEDGWNLVANPYPSAIDWDAASGWTRTNVGGTIYVYNADNQQFSTYTLGGASTNGGSRYIASSQAFFIQTSAVTPVLQCTEQVKVNQNPTFLRMPRSLEQPEYLKLTLTGMGYSDEALIGFNNNATAQFDPAQDAYKFRSFDYYPCNISSCFNGVDYAVNMLNPDQLSFEIPIKAVTGTNGVYTLRLEPNSTLLSYTCIQLVDLFNGQVYPVEVSGTEVSFSLSDTTSLPRFKLLLNRPYSATVQSPTCQDTASFVKVINNLGQPQNFVLTNSVTGAVYPFTVVGAEYKMNVSPSIYLLENSGSQLCGSNLHELIISPLDNPVNIEIGMDKDTLVLDIEGQLNFYVDGTYAAGYSWDFGNGQYSNNVAEQIIYSSPGEYIVTLVGNTGMCYDTAYASIIVLPTSPTSIINLPGSGKFLKGYLSDGKLLVAYNHNLKNAHLSLMDVNGRVVCEKEIFESTTQTTMEGFKVATGVYTLVLNQGMAKVSAKVIIH